jgi:hypothetical protein
MDEEPWDIEIAYYATYKGLDQDKAQTLTIMRWMWSGDLRPLAAAIAEDRLLAPGVLNLMHDMILDGRIAVIHKHAGPGRPKRRQPELFARMIVAALWYLKRPNRDNSDEEFENIASALGVSHQTVRQAVTAFRSAHPHAN